MQTYNTSESKKTFQQVLMWCKSHPRVIYNNNLIKIVSFLNWINTELEVISQQTIESYNQSIVNAKAKAMPHERDTACLIEYRVKLAPLFIYYHKNGFNQIIESDLSVITSNLNQILKRHDSSNLFRSVAGHMYYAEVGLQDIFKFEKLLSLLLPRKKCYDSGKSTKTDELEWRLTLNMPQIVQTITAEDLATIYDTQQIYFMLNDSSLLDNNDALHEFVEKLATAKVLDKIVEPTLISKSRNTEVCDWLYDKFARAYPKTVQLLFREWSSSINARYYPIKLFARKLDRQEFEFFLNEYGIRKHLIMPEYHESQILIEAAFNEDEEFFSAFLEKVVPYCTSNLESQRKQEKIKGLLGLPNQNKLGYVPENRRFFLDLLKNKKYKVFELMIQFAYEHTVLSTLFESETVYSWPLLEFLDRENSQEWIEVILSALLKTKHLDLLEIPYKDALAWTEKETLLHFLIKRGDQELLSQFLALQRSTYGGRASFEKLKYTTDLLTDENLQRIIKLFPSKFYCLFDKEFIYYAVLHYSCDTFAALMHLDKKITIDQLSSKHPQSDLNWVDIVIAKAIRENWPDAKIDFLFEKAYKNMLWASLVDNETDENQSLTNLLALIHVTEDVKRLKKIRRLSRFFDKKSLGYFKFEQALNDKNKTVGIRLQNNECVSYDGTFDQFIHIISIGLFSWIDYYKLLQRCILSPNEAFHDDKLDVLKLLRKFKVFGIAGYNYARNAQICTECFRGNVLVKIFTGWQPYAWPEFLQQLKDTTKRAMLREPLEIMPGDTLFKYHHLTNKIVLHKGKRSTNKPSHATHAKKTSCTLIARNLQTPLFQSHHEHFLLVGVAMLADTNLSEGSPYLIDRAKIKACMIYDNGTYHRPWVGSIDQVIEYKKSINGKNFTLLEEFKSKISEISALNEVLAKPSKESLLGIVIGRFDKAHVIKAREYQTNVRKVLGLDLPIILYESNKSLFVPDIKFMPETRLVPLDHVHSVIDFYTKKANKIGSQEFRSLIGITSVGYLICLGAVTFITLSLPLFYISVPIAFIVLISLLHAFRQKRNSNAINELIMPIQRLDKACKQLHEEKKYGIDLGEAHQCLLAGFATRNKKQEEFHMDMFTDMRRQINLECLPSQR